MIRTAWQSLLLGALLVSLGCGPKASQPSAESSANTGDAKPNKAIVETAADSQRRAGGIEITIQSTPQEVCQQFMYELTENEVIKAEKLLTPEAVLQIRNCQLELGAPGGPDAEYQFGEPQYESIQQKIAFVPCKMRENEDVQEFSMMLRRSPHGWKISGMLFYVEDQKQDLYSFENPEDVATIKSLIGTDTRQASLTGTMR